MSDLYISPIDFKPGQDEHSDTEIALEKGKKIKFQDYELVFTGFKVPEMMGKQDLHEMHVGAEISVSYKDEPPVILQPILTAGQLHSPSSRVKLPGAEEAYLTLARIDATSKSISLLYHGPTFDEEEATRSRAPAVIAEVSIKPGMTLLWLGTFLILLGGSIAIPRRWSR